MGLIRDNLKKVCVLYHFRDYFSYFNGESEFAFHHVILHPVNKS
jgi:hypothetical protein